MFVQRKYERDNDTQPYMQRKNERDNITQAYLQRKGEREGRGERFYKIRFYKIQHNSIQHNCVYVVVYVCRNVCVWVFYLVETNLVETKACREKLW